MNGADVGFMELEHIACNLCHSKQPRPFFAKDGYNLVCCRNCGLVYVTPRPTEQSLAMLYSKDYFAYKKLDTNIEQTLDALIEKAAKSIIWSFISSNHKRFLEIGCAEGSYVKVAQSRGMEAKGIEVSDWAAAIARDMLHVTVYTGTLEMNLEKLSIGSFDVIYMGDVIEHVHNPFELLKQVNSLLSSNGILIMNTPNINSLSLKLLRENWRVISPERHLYYFSLRTMKNLLASAGFSESKITISGLEYKPLLRFIANKASSQNGESRQQNASFQASRRSSNVKKLVVGMINKFLHVSQLGDTMLIIAKKAK